MLVAKQVADLMTFCRLLMSVFLVWLGLVDGKSGLPFAGWTMLLSWTSDALDGPIARRSKVKYNSWLGDHDLQVDMAVCAGLLGYFMLSNYLSPQLGILYLFIWGLIFWRWGIQRSPGMLFQAAPFAFLIYLSLRYSLPEGIALITWIIGVIILTWPRFPQEVVPGFLHGMRFKLKHKKSH